MLPRPTTSSVEPGTSQELLRILVVSEDEADRDVVRRGLQQAGVPTAVDEATTVAESLARMGAAVYDCVLLDARLSDADSGSLLETITAASPHVPLVTFAGHYDEEILVELITAGAADYPPHASPASERIASSVRHAMEVARVTALARRAENALHEQEARFRRAMQIETVGVLFFDLDGRITDGNDAFVRMSGYTRDDMAAGRVRWDELTPPEWMPDSLRAVEEFIATGYTTPYEKEYIRPDGSRWWGLFAATRLTEQQGLEFVLDITEQKSAAEERARLFAAEQAARAEAEAAVRARDEFVAVISHDLQNPLTALRGHVQMLRRTTAQGKRPTAQQLAASLEAIDASAMRLSAQIDELQDATRLQAGQPLDLQPSPADLVALAREIIQRYQQISEAHQLRFEAAVPTLIGTWDIKRLERVLANLLSNAIKYSPAGGTVTVTVSWDGDWAVLMVADDGIGIPAKDTPRLFERYWRASNVPPGITGSGLGLAGAKDIVTQHGGHIAARSEEGQGTTFIVRLPAAAPREPEK